MKIQELIERISEEIVLADSDNLQALAILLQHFDDLKSEAKGKRKVDIRRACDAITELIRAIILGEVNHPEESFKVASQAISALQQMIRDGRPIGEVGFPDELDLDIGAAENPKPELKDIDDKAGSSEVEVIDANCESAVIAVEISPADEKPVLYQLKGDPGLLADFITEANEHLDSAEIHLLTLETTSQDTEAINAVFRCFHTIKGVAGFLALDEIRILAHESESLLDKARKNELELANEAMDVTFDAVDLLKRMVASLKECLESGTDLPSEPSLPQVVVRIKAVLSGKPFEIEKPNVLQISKGQRVGDILVESGYASQDDIGDALVKQRQEGPASPRIGEILVKDGIVAAKDVAEALRAQKGEGRHGAVVVKESLRVDADRLDLLVDTIGELVIAESMVSQSEELIGNASANLARQISLLNKITRELQEMGSALRMVEVRPTFQKMARLLRDLAKKADKKIEFITHGEETELDKSVIDQIGDPLVHMIRNSVDHGIEGTAEDRINAGKPEIAKVVLSAFHKGGNIFIEVEDDGRGIDREAVVKKAIERQIIKETDSLTDNEILSLIFEPGLSTTKVITDVSGRGVGMDVVRRNIEALRGQIVVTSEKGTGTKISIQLPLTLAIIDGMVVRVGTEKFIIPTTSIIRSMRPTESELSTVMKQGEMLTVHNELVPLVRLGSLLGICDRDYDLTNGIVVVIEDDGQKSGLFVDDLLGQQQIVIKSLGESMRGTPGISGAAIMPDGSVGLILDVSKLGKLASSERNCLATKPAALTSITSSISQ
jgi:two-component system, chemotaxis family, sensor kinase CheA